jgi:hypothetical protein
VHRSLERLDRVVDRHRRQDRRFASAGLSASYGTTMRWLPESRRITTAVFGKPFASTSAGSV